MKKIIGVSLVLALSVVSFAQSNEQIQNKKGVDIMPVQGEFAIGMNALPALNYIGDLFGVDDNNNALSGNKFVSYFSSNTLFGKYMLTNNTAVRGHLRIGQFNNSFQNDVFDDTKNSPDSTVRDTYSSNQSIVNLGIGYEWRRGKTRLRGIYGGELMYQFRTGTTRNYSYGNAFGAGNAAPTATTWSTGGGVISESPEGERIVSVNGGNFNGIGVRAFAGVEYFIAPKICIGTEFGWGIMGGFTSASSSTTEFWDPTAETTGAVRTDEITGSKGRSFTADTDNFGGSLYFMFYF